MTGLARRWQLPPTGTGPRVEWRVQNLPAGHSFRVIGTHVNARGAAASPAFTLGTGAGNVVGSFPICLGTRTAPPVIGPPNAGDVCDGIRLPGAPVFTYTIDILGPGGSIVDLRTATFTMSA